MTSICQTQGMLQQAAESLCWAAADWQAAWACRLWHGACLEELLPRAVAQLLVVLLQDLAQPNCIDLGILTAPMRLLSQPVRLHNRWQQLPGRQCCTTAGPSCSTVGLFDTQVQ